MKMKFLVVMSILWSSSLLLAWCANNEAGIDNNENVSGSMDTGFVMSDVVDDIEVWEEGIIEEWQSNSWGLVANSEEVIVNSWSVDDWWIVKNEEWKMNSWEVAVDVVELQDTVKELIDERKEDLWDSDELTEEDIQLIEDILDELVQSVE